MLKPSMDNTAFWQKFQTCDKNFVFHLVPFSFRSLHTDNHWQMTSYTAASWCPSWFQEDKCTICR